MVSRLFYYLVGVFVLGFLVSTVTMAVLSFLPWVVAFFVVIMPIYGCFRIRRSWNHQNFGMKQWIKKIAKTFSFRKSWNFYLILGVAMGFAFDEMVKLMVATLVVMIATLLGMNVLWEAVRWIMKKYKGIMIPSYIEACRYFWR